MTQPLLPLTVPVPPLDLPQASQDRDTALATVEAHAPDGFADVALVAVRLAALAYVTFIVDDVWRYMPDKPIEARAMGPVMLKACRMGWIAKTHEFQTSAQPACHGNPRRIWRSLLVRPDGSRSGTDVRG